LQEFATAVQQQSHCTYTAMTEDNIRREAGKVFANRVEDTAIKI
jgi:hypothetical protein